MDSKVAAIAVLGLASLVLAVVLIPAGPPLVPARPVGGASVEKSATQRQQSSSPAAEPQTAMRRIGPDAGLPRAAASGSGRAVGAGRDRERSMAELAVRLAALPPEEALARIAELPDQESRDMAMLALLGELSGLSSLELIRQGDVWRFGSGGALAVHLLESGKITPSEAVAIIQQNTDGNRRGELLVRIGAKLAAEDPAAALALGTGLEGWERQRFLEGLANQWGEASPEEARRWIATVADARTRDALISGLLQAEIRNDPAIAAANFASMAPADDSARARAAQRIASEWASKDTLAAMQWANSLQGEAERNAAGQGISAAAPVGIGAMLNRGPDGLPVVGNLVPGGPASVSGALQTGDALLAVSDANGSWVDARGMPLRDLLGMVRGEPNTQVSLQVLSPGSSAPRTVTIGRQQLIFRPQQ